MPHSRKLKRAWGLPHSRKLKRAWGLPHSRQQNSALGASPIRASKNPMCSSLCSSPAWWLWRGVHTRSHLELGRKSPQRQWYFVLRRGRVGRCQACKEQRKPFIHDSNNQNPAAREISGGVWRSGGASFQCGVADAQSWTTAFAGLTPIGSDIDGHHKFDCPVT